MSEDNAEKKMLSVRVPKELHELVGADKRTNQEIVQAALWREFGGQRKAALDRRIEEKERRISMIRSEKNERERELEEQLNELNALNQKRESVHQKEDERRQKQLDKLCRVPRDADHPLVQEVAGELDMEPTEALEEAYERD